MKENLSHAEMIESMTGGMVIPSREFAGSNRLFDPYWAVISVRAVPIVQQL